MCNVGNKSPAAFFAVPSLAPQDRLANYHVEWDSVLDEWHVTHHPKKFLDSWGMNAKVFGEPRPLHQQLPAITNIATDKEINHAKQNTETAEALCSKNNDPASESITPRIVEDAQNVGDNHEHAKPKIAESKTEKPEVTDAKDDNEPRQSMAIDTKLAQELYKQSSSSPLEVVACLPKATSSSPELPDTPPTASTTSPNNNRSRFVSLASSPKLPISPSTSISSTPEKKAVGPQISPPASSVISPKPNIESTSAPPEPSSSMFSHLSTKGKGGKKAKAKKTKVGKNTRGANKEDLKNMPIPHSKDESLLGSAELTAYHGKTDDDAGTHTVAEMKALVDEGKKAEEPPTLFPVLRDQQLGAQKAQKAQNSADPLIVAEPQGMPSTREILETSPPATIKSTKPNKSSSLPDPGAALASIKEIVPIMSDSGTMKSSTLGALSQLSSNDQDHENLEKNKKPEAKNVKNEDLQADAQLSLPSLANKDVSASLPVSSLLEHPCSVFTSSAPAPKPDGASLTSLSSSTISRNAISLAASSQSPMVAEKPASKDSSLSLFTPPSTIGKGKKKGRAGKKAQAKKSTAAQKIGDILGASHVQHNGIVKHVAVLPTDMVLEPAKPALHDQLSLSGKDTNAQADIGIETTMDTATKVSTACDSTSITKSKQVGLRKSEDPDTEITGENHQGLEVAAKVPSQGAIISPVFYNPNRLILPAGPSMSSEKIEPAVSEDGNGDDRGFRDRDQTPNIVITNADNKVTETPSGIDPCPDMDSTEGAPNQSHRTLPQGTTLSLGMLKAWINGEEDNAQIESLPFENPAPLTDLAPAKKAIQIDDLPRVDEVVPNANVTQPEDIAEASTGGDDSLATVMNNISDSPPMADSDPSVTTAQDVYNPLCLLSPGETPWFVEKMSTLSGGDTSLEELMPNSEEIDQVSTSGDAPVDVLVDQPGSAAEANLDLDASTAQADLEQLKQKSDNNAEVSIGDSQPAVVDNPSQSPSEATLDVDIDTVQPFYNPQCLLLPGEISWFLEKMKSSARGDTDEEELKPNSQGQPSLDQHDNGQQKTDAAVPKEQKSNHGIEHPEELRAKTISDAVVEEDQQLNDLISHHALVAGPLEPVDNLPQTEMEAAATIPQLSMEQAKPTMPLKTSEDPSPKTEPVVESQASSILETQNLAEVAAMVSDATAALAQSLRNKPSPTHSTDRPAEQNTPSEPAKDSKTSILDPEKLIEVTTTVPKTREERFMLLELICVLIVRFVGSFLM